ncbi:hypothetical protein T4A_4402 [Trichinella pseudospiralis]|uniref:Uncharacterized protein n=1 Tax=Trichinella pseudospiralis TaxID=6337 RepID=A0A0V1E0B8_TRIPS|nr:hypothetical protein T4A_4402 [Trichinella pseudospiralis]
MDTIFDETLPMQMTVFKFGYKTVAEIYKMSFLFELIEIPMSFVMNLLSSITGLDILINKNDKRQRRKCFRRE